MSITVFKKMKDPKLQEAMRLVSLSALAGALIAVAVQLFRLLSDMSEYYLLWSLGGYLPPSETGRPEIFADTWLWSIPLATTVGGLISGVICYALAPEVAGGGENAVIAAFHKAGGAVRKRVAIVRMIASAVTIGSGGAAGREGPMAQISASLACSVASVFRLSIAERRTLVIAATAAGISAIFGSPLGAAFLSVEILYRKLDMEVDALMYAIIAASVAYSINGILYGWSSLFVIPKDLVFEQSHHLIWYALLGLFAGALSTLIPVIFHKTQTIIEAIKLPRVLKPAIGGFLLGCIGMFVPGVLGAGYGWMQAAMNGQLALGTLLLLGSLKILAFSLTVGSGGAGGVFAPVLFSGAMFGAAFAQVLSLVLHTPPDATIMTIVGMAAFFSGVGRAPVATLVIATEMAAAHSLLVPTMLAVSLSFIVNTLFTSLFSMSDETLYDAQVGTRADSPTHQQEYVQLALDLVGKGGLNVSGPVGLPDIHRFLELGKPIPVGDNGEFLYRGMLEKDSPVIGKQIRDLPFVEHVLIVSISRDGEGQEITPRGATVIEANDELAFIAHPSVLSELTGYVEVPLLDKQRIEGSNSERRESDTV